MAIVYFKRKYPRARIRAFEPDGMIFDTLSRNMQAFGFEDVRLHNAAIWTGDADVDFQREGGFSGRIPKRGDTQRLIRVRAVRLRDLLDESVDFLKIDIEGAETEVLRDCADRLYNVKYIFCEYHSHIAEKQTLDEILSIFSAAAFRYQIKEAHTSPHPFVERPPMLGMDLQLDLFGFRV